jgi:hypothetical protein
MTQKPVEVTLLRASGMLSILLSALAVLPVSGFPLLAIAPVSPVEALDAL